MRGAFISSIPLTYESACILAGSAIVLALVWTLVRHRLRVKIPRKWVIAMCVVLSIAAHVVLLMYLPGFPGNGGSQGIGPGGPTGADAALAPIAIDTLAADEAENRTEDSAETMDRPLELHAPPMPVQTPTPQPLPEETPTQSVSAVAPAMPQNTQSFDAVDQMLSDLLLADANRADQQSAVDSMPTDPTPTPMPELASLATNAPAVAIRSEPNTFTGDLSASTQGVATPQHAAHARQVPTDFANRDPNARWAAVRQGGGDERTEAAVAAALAFLASTQEPDGSWSAAKHGAGREEQVFGHTRGGAGRNADSGVTGLALLSMLGRGVTPQDPQYGTSLTRGLNYLRAIQRPDGCLAGQADTYASMYCHGIAALAMCEALALSGDPQLRQPTYAALAYTVKAQHPTTGGWRYQPGETGDMSQFGWQAMALQTGVWAGLPVSETIRPKLETFLRSVRGGNQGGLACYRPGERPTASMTAEALASRLLLGFPVPEHEAIEAETLILAERPGVGRDNLYFWYYASLALQQRGNSAWDLWNQAMKARLLSTQGSDGSWPTDSIWGGYGGRIYTTSLGALCLEVYYRHLAIQRGGSAIATQPSPFPTTSRR